MLVVVGIQVKDWFQVIFMIRKKMCTISSPGRGAMAFKILLIGSCWRSNGSRNCHHLHIPQTEAREEKRHPPALCQCLSQDCLSLREIFNCLVVFSTPKHRFIEEFLSNVRYSSSFVVCKGWNVASGWKERSVIYISGLEVRLSVKNFLSSYGNIKTEFVCYDWYMYVWITVPVTTNS